MRIAKKTKRVMKSTTAKKRKAKMKIAKKTKKVKKSTTTEPTKKSSTAKTIKKRKIKL